MSTDRTLIVLAQRDVTPKTVLYDAVLPEAGAMTPLSGYFLRRMVELQATKRQLNWEEWMDIREAWCQHYRVGYVACVRGDSAAIRAAAQRAEQDGNTFILIEYI